ncbi:MAG: hypothetical protein IPM54_37660 [Polyangiaceae bacterium]|nr:hypothetical protein [Polyangiaceae bacterium]
MQKASCSFVIVAFLVAGCGASSSSPSSDAAKVPSTRREAQVYDSAGQAKTCEPPSKECAAPEMNRELQERCALAGYRMVHCGCEMLCMGKPQPAEKMLYDAEGNAKACAKASEDCSPPPASAAYQDACNDKGYKLEVCGCEWLCTGNPAK